MIYFDNSATTLVKPPEVAEAVSYAVSHFANAHRSFYDPAMLAAREVYETREQIARLLNIEDALNIAFTSSATESLNLVIGGLINPGDQVMTTICEHNSVLRPLYISGCKLSLLDCDDNGNLIFDESSFKSGAKYFVCTHGSNVTGNMNDAARLHEMCRKRGITMILDASQTLGEIHTGIDMADILCFTGHKGLFGPQGTGGIALNGTFEFKIVKTGGAGVDSFAKTQSLDMPGIFEVGTMNGHSIYGLQKGVAFINEKGVEVIHAKETDLTYAFYDGVKRIDGVHVYGDFEQKHRLPIVSINLGDMDSTELAAILWNKYSICTRAGSHCAPMLHKHFGTVKRGMVRFSFSYFNTLDEIECAVAALSEIAAQKS